MTKSNDDIPADELLLAEAIAAAKANGMDWCEGTLFVDRNGFHLDAHGKTIGQIRQAAYGCCALGALYLAGHQNGFARTFDESVTLGNDYERNWFGDTAAPDGETLMDVDASAESLGWAFRCAMTQEEP